MKIYTKTGDDGTTGLFGGSRVSKNDPRIQATGTVDELNAQLGLCVAACSDTELLPILFQLQRDCFLVGADLATPLTHPHKTPRLTAHHIEQLEKWIDQYDAALPELHAFILPGGSLCGAQLHVARTFCRRAERAVIALSQTTEITPSIGPYLNRLSDLLFVLARSVNHRSQQPEVEWHG